MSLKKIIYTVGVILSMSISAFGSNQLDTNALINSICDVETGGQYWRIGAAGERSQYQIKSDVWAKYSRVPFWKARQKQYQDEARRVAECYIRELSNRLKTRGRAVTARNIALYWNGGPNRSKYSAHSISYAARVQNLYQVYVTSTSASSHTSVSAYKPLKITISADLVAGDDPMPVIRIDLKGTTTDRIVISPVAIIVPRFLASL